MIRALAVVIALAGSASANPACAPRGHVVDRLMTKYGESPVSVGLGSKGALVEVFANQASGTWTIVVTRPDGISCLAASGQDFMRIDALPAGDAL